MQKRATPMRVADRAVADPQVYVGTKRVVQVVQVFEGLHS
jgi:hypothetical protein